MTCIVFQGSKDRDGYGQVHRKGRTFRAHRVAYEDAHGPIPVGLHVLHSCDNPSCVNPDHLRVGTHQENMDDRNARGRTAVNSQPGQLNGMSKLSNDQRDRIIAALQEPRRGLASELAAVYGVHRQTISRIKKEAGL